MESKFASKITRLGEKDRIKTFVKGLDERLEGGVPKNSVVLVAGKAGSMKSSFCFSILYHQAISEGRRGVYISLEQNRQSLLEHMLGLGMDVTDMDPIDALSCLQTLDQKTIYGKTRRLHESAQVP